MEKNRESTFYLFFFFKKFILSAPSCCWDSLDGTALGNGVWSLPGLGRESLSTWQRSDRLGWEPEVGKFGFGIQMFAAPSPLLEET